jgi:alanine racemase
MAYAHAASAELQIDLRAVGDNWQLLANRAAPGMGCAAVVKADAYGLGMGRVAPALYARGCRDLFVAQLEEANTLKPLLASDPRVFVLQGGFDGTESDCLAAGVIPVRNSLDQVKRWQEVALVGRVSMDTITVDVSHIHADRLVPGALFVVIDNAHDINALALEAGTNAYEMLTSLGQRYSRNYSEI